MNIEQEDGMPRPEAGGQFGIGVISAGLADAVRRLTDSGKAVPL